MSKEGMSQPSPDAAFIPESAAERLEQLREARERIAPPLGQLAELAKRREEDAEEIGEEAMSGAGVEVLGRVEEISGDRLFFHFTSRGQEIINAHALQPRSEHGMGGSKADESNGVHFTSPPREADIAKRSYAYDSQHYLNVGVSNEIIGTDDPFRIAVVSRLSNMAEALDTEEGAVLSASVYGDEETPLDERDINDCIFSAPDGEPLSVGIDGMYIIAFDGIKWDSLTEEERLMPNDTNDEFINRQREILFRQRFKDSGYTREWFDEHVVTAREIESTLAPIEMRDTWVQSNTYWASDLSSPDYGGGLGDGIAMRTMKDYLDRGRADETSKPIKVQAVQGIGSREPLDDDKQSGRDGTSRLKLKIG